MMDNLQEYEEYELNGEEYLNKQDKENYEEFDQNQEKEQDVDYIEEQFNEDIKDDNNSPDDFNNALEKKISNNKEKKGPIDG